jgi:repressor of nif and glnA expression
MSDSKKHSSEQDTLDSIKQDILNVLSNSKKPVSTQDIAEKVARPWHSIQTRCLKLQLEGKVDGFKVGRINLWEIKKKQD